MDIKRIETLTKSELLSEGQVARLRAREETETQRVLRSALERLGPNGENWCKSKGWFDSETGSMCAIGAIGLAQGRPSCAVLFDCGEPERFLRLAAKERGYAGVESLNDSRATAFADIQTLYARAITLAATP